MNHHVLLDRLSVYAAAAFGGPGYFVRRADSPPLKEHVASTHITSKVDLHPGVHEISADTRAGILDTAYLVHRWHADDYPTVIYHHGNQERPFNLSRIAKNTFRTVLAGRTVEIPANLIAMRAPYHACSTREYLYAVGDLNSFAAMIAASTVLLEKLVATARNRGSPAIMAAGISLGGWVVNLHHALFNTADTYMPLLAGAALDEVFITSEYRRLTGGEGRHHSAFVHTALNFEQDFANMPHRNVFPLLAAHDQFVVLERQRTCYGAQPVKVLNKGHVTASLASAELRAQIVSHLPQ